MKSIAAFGLSAIVIFLPLLSAAADPEAPVVIGGLTPDRRPEGLPLVTETGLTMFGMVRELHGVARPYPPLDFLDDQLGWYTPFSHPGMTAPYDIRNWHGAD